MSISRIDLTRLLAPADCLGCRALGAGVVCGACLEGLEPAMGAGCRRCHNPEVADSALSCPWCEALKQVPDDFCAAYHYRGKGRELYQLLKYRGYWQLAEVFLEQHLAAVLAQLPFMEYAALVPIPESFRRKVTRAFNPAAQIALVLARLTGLPVVSPLRLKPRRKQQVGLGAEARRKNARGRFYVRGEVPRSLILVDDVMTTGATLDAAHESLARAGARQIAWMSLFRVL